MRMVNYETIVFQGIFYATQVAIIHLEGDNCL
jgi:hypothetical protein